MDKRTLLQKSETPLQVDNAIIQLGDIDDSGKGKKFKSRFIQAGVAGYPGTFGNVLVKKETLDKYINSMVGVPVIINHKDVTVDNADDLRVGVVSDVYFNEKDGWYWCNGVIWNETAQDLIKEKGWSVSCSYDALECDDEGGSENNIKYDREFTKMNFTHLALVNNPRYERANIVFNSKEKKEFVTVGEGESAHAIPVEYLEKDKKEKNDNSEQNNKITISKEYKENVEHYGKKEHQEEIISLYEGLKSKTKTDERKKEDLAYLKYHLKELKKYNNPNFEYSGKKLDDEVKKIEKEIESKQNKYQETIKLNETIQNKTKAIQNVVKEIAEKTDINLSDYVGYAEDKGWSKKNRLYIDYDKLKQDWARKNNGNNYRDALYWLEKRTNSEYNGGWGTFVTVKNTLENSLEELITAYEPTKADLPLLRGLVEVLNGLGESDSDLQWITVNGTHIPILKGQSKENAIQKFTSHQENKSILKQHKNKTQELQRKKSSLASQAKKLENLKKANAKEEQIQAKSKDLEKTKKEISNLENEINDIEKSDKFKNAKNDEQSINEYSDLIFKKEKEVRQENKLKEKIEFEKAQKVVEAKASAKFDKLTGNNETLKHYANKFIKAEESIQGGGYSGYSMSNRAEKAYIKGFVPISKLNKQEKEIAQKLGAKEWHHSSKFANKVDFYDKNLIDLIKNKASVEVLKNYIKLENEYNTSAWHLYDEEQDLNKWLNIINHLNKKSDNSILNGLDSLLSKFNPQKSDLPLLKGLARIFSLGE